MQTVYRRKNKHKKLQHRTESARFDLDNAPSLDIEVCLIWMTTWANVKGPNVVNPSLTNSILK